MACGARIEMKTHSAKLLRKLRARGSKDVSSPVDWCNKRTQCSKGSMVADKIVNERERGKSAGSGCRGGPSLCVLIPFCLRLMFSHSVLSNPAGETAHTSLPFKKGDAESMPNVGVSGCCCASLSCGVLSLADSEGSIDSRDGTPAPRIEL